MLRDRCLSVCLSVCNVGVLWPSCCMDQDASNMSLGMEVGLSPGDILLDRDSASPHGKRHSSPPLFRPCLLWPNGWIDQDTTWYLGLPWPRRRFRWRPSSPVERGTVAPRLVSPCLLWPNCCPSQQLLSSCLTEFEHTYDVCCINISF